MRVRRDNEEFEVGDRIPVLPLRDVVVFPYMIVPLLVGREPSLRALEAAGSGDRMVLALTQRGPEVEEPGAADLFRVGTVCRIVQLLRLPDGTMRVLVEGIARFRVTRFLRNPGVFYVRGAAIDESYEMDAEVEALLRNARSRFEEYVRHHRRIPNEILISVNSVEEPRRQVHVMAAHLASRLEVKQQLLETQDLREQLVDLASHLSEELEILGIERKIEGEVRSQVHKSQREFWLTEQLKAIRKELGEPGEPGGDGDDLEELVRGAKMPAEVEKKALKEVERLRRMAAMSPEATVIRTYIDWLVALPWKKRTRDRLDVEAASKILNEDHYGLEKVKDRILEYLAVLKLVGHMKGPILCLVGPPGVGKTSLGQSVARAMGRKFVRVSLGGVRDEAEIRGHRRTYIGSMPGRIIQRMRHAGTRNPVFLLDEVDKLASDYRGDPAAALLEVLDPEQNTSFSDHYLDVEFDLSEVLFIATANSTSTIPPALRDRMEILRLPGYQEHEKIRIASGYLVPKNLKSHGLDAGRIGFAPAALRALVRGYTREAGVRSLEREIAAICRKLARESTTGAAKRRAGARRLRRVTAADIARFLGSARFPDVELLPESLVGVASGLAWTEVGGEVLRVEAVKLPGAGRLTLTGKLGKVMQESGRAALTFARTRAASLGLSPDFYKKLDMHVHIPEGAIPKDGPSAGVTMAVAVVSALSGVAVRRDVALTGEITLTGEVLPVGGLNEKVVAARRAGFRTIVIPHGNRKDLVEMPRLLTRGVEFRPVKTVDEALRVALVSDPAPRRSATDPAPVASVTTPGAVAPGGVTPGAVPPGAVPPAEPPPGLAH